jgi:hypothetical protein
VESAPLANLSTPPNETGYLYASICAKCPDDGKMLKRLEDASEVQSFIDTIDDHIFGAAIRNSPENRVEGDYPRLSSDA